MLKLPPEPIVSTTWLDEHRSDPTLRIVDVRGLVLPPTAPKPHYFASHDLYLEGHIPGAVFVDWTRDIVDLDDPVPVQVAPPEQYADLMRRLGIGDNAPVVAYDSTVPFFAARLLWTLRYYGHDRVRVLDGGIAKWVAEGRPVELTVPQYPPAVFTPRPQPQLRRTVEEVMQALGTATVLIDGRSPKEFDGQESRAARGGHIPGAINVFYGDLLTGRYRTFAPPDELRARFEQAGLDLATAGDLEIVTYCNGGVSALVTSLAMEIAGGPAPALYDGSWNEWGNRSDLPLEQ